MKSLYFKSFFILVLNKKLTNNKNRSIIYFTILTNKKSYEKIKKTKKG